MASASDNFNRADENPLAGNWTTITSVGAMRIVSNAAHCAGTGRSGAYYNAVSFSDNHYSEVTIGSGGEQNESGAGLAARVSTTEQTCYYVYTRLSTTDWYINLYRCVNGSFASIGTSTVQVQSNDVIRLTCNGSTISVTQNGVERISVPDTNIPNGAYAGIWSFATSRDILSWSAGDLVEAATALPRRAISGPFYGSLRGPIS